jgi:predicted Zn-dependent protease with MMP-like domain
MTYEEMQKILSDISDKLPAEIYAGLNGGIILSPDTKLHPQSVSDELLINGEYHFDPYGLGRYIVLYYGSLRRSFGHLPKERQIERVKEVLKHELTHHLEHQAGDKTLEKKDAAELNQYKRKHEKEN